MRAYHYVFGGPEALDRILEAGEILPAVQRIDASVIRQKCEDDFIGIFFEGKGSGRRSKTAVAALRELIEERITEIRAAQADMGASPGETQFRCVDLLAGDLRYVFLSMHNWVWEARVEGFKPNGFVFDAEELVQAGGSVRIGDLFEAYDLAVTELVYHRRPRSAAEAKRWLMREFARIQGTGRTLEKELDLLSRSIMESEIIFPGPLPLDLAVEIWREGRLEAVRGRETHQRDKR